jgi:hypothetical protein
VPFPEVNPWCRGSESAERKKDRDMRRMIINDHFGLNKVSKFVKNKK